MGNIILLADKTNASHVLAYSSKKSKRVVRSIMAGEIFAFTIAFDNAFVSRHNIERAIGKPIGLAMFIDSKQLFDAISTASHTTEKRLMVETSAAREAYNRHEISNVGLIAGADNPSDGLTKVKKCETLEKLINSGIDNTEATQWIYRQQVQGETCPTTSTLRCEHYKMRVCHSS